MTLPWEPMWTLIGLGLIFLAFGGDFLVKASVDIAARMGVSPLLIGLTLVGFGTSTPELATSLQAALVHSPGIAVGNIVGSNIANILLILGVSALLMPVAASAGAIFRDGLFVVLTAALLAWASLRNALGPEMGALFIGLLIVYVLTAWVFERSDPGSERTIEVHDVSGLGQSVVVAIGSIGILIVGAGMLVDGSVQLAKSLGLSETFIGLTLVAVGTSLPELFTSVSAALRRQSDIAIGNVLGSNIYNILGIGGVVALVHPVEIPQQIAGFDNFVMIGVSVLLLAWLILARGLGRLGGIVFIALYAGYVALIHPANKGLMDSVASAFAPLAEMLKAIGS